MDTSRNGWGGPDRPSGPSPSTSLDTFVNESRVDRRARADNWGNRIGTSLGERPRAAPHPGIDAYAWIKPPGESDGASSAGTAEPNRAGKGYDPLCNPIGPGWDRGNYRPTGALPDAPAYGEWHSAQFRQLLTNAHPPL